MKCPTCADTDHKLYGAFCGCRTLMGWQSYYHNGVYHSHDPNYTTCDVHCSNGHYWTVKIWSGCPDKACDYREHYEWKERTPPEPAKTVYLGDLTPTDSDLITTWTKKDIKPLEFKYQAEPQYADCPPIVKPYKKEDKS